MNNKAIELTKEFEKNTAALILSAQNRYYLTGTYISEGAVLITKDNVYLFADSRYFEAAEKNARDLKVIKLLNLNNQLNDIISELGIKSVLIESEYVTISELNNLKKGVNAEIVSDDFLSAKLKKMRAVKTDEELKNIVLAQEITDNTFAYIIDRIKPGRTEKEVMLDMEFYSRKIGSEEVAFDFIVVSGKNSSLPHGVPTDKEIEKGDFLTMDFGAVVAGYRSDMTRTIAVGSVNDEQRLVYDTVLNAQVSAIKAAKAGKECNSIDKIARDIIADAGYDEYFGHGLGHSVGIDIHEEPTLSPRSKDVLNVGNIVTVEPGIYLPDKFGVRIEDMIYITENGNKDLTASPKELIIV